MTTIPRCIGTALRCTEMAGLAMIEALAKDDATSLPAHIVAEMQDVVARLADVSDRLKAVDASQHMRFREK